MKAVVVLCALAVRASAAPVNASAVIDRPEASVGEVVIWQSDVDARMTGQEAKLRPSVIDAMIEEEIWVTAALAAHIEVDASEVTAALAEIKQQNNLDDAGLDKALTQAGYTRARYLVDLKRQLLRLRARNQLVALRVQIVEADIDTEAKKRSLKFPLSTDDREKVRRELRRQQTDKLEGEWMATQKKRTRIWRRS